MIDGLKPYPKYKDSGVPWLGEVPEHWDVRRLKNVFREIDKRSTTGTEPLLSLRMDHGLVDHHALGGKVISSEALIGYKKTVPGEIVMNRMRAAAGLFAATSVSGLVSPDYAVLRPRVQIVHEYFVRLFRTPALMSVFRAESRGLGTGESGFLRLYTESFGEIASSYPSLEEQRAIARYLQHQDQRISRYIRTKKKLIALLNEQKQAIIHRAVTRGLDPNAPLKRSGVEWLGDVPMHWKVVPLRRMTISRCDGPFGSGLKSIHYTSSGIRVIRLQNIGHGEFKASDSAYISEEHYASLGDHSVAEGDVLIAGLGDERHPAGRACVAPASILPAMVKADCFRFRVNRRRLDPSFAALHLTATAAASAASLSTGATRQRTNLQGTAGRAICVPPIEEQILIWQSLSVATRPAVIAAAVAEREIALLRELRIRLVADIVTGKLDVREAAASLPDEEVADELSEIGDTPEEIAGETEGGGDEVEE
jgi:type I restriction enzyme S subunit